MNEYNLLKLFYFIIYSVTLRRITMCNKRTSYKYIIYMTGARININTYININTECVLPLIRVLVTLIIIMVTLIVVIISNRYKESILVQEAS